MYEGYLTLDGVEVVNTHRTAAYAQAAGLPWVQGCAQCDSIRAWQDNDYQTPMLDAKRGSPPPWWNANNPDSLEFFGVMGLSMSNVDDSTRRVDVLSAAGGGGHFGPLRYQPRSMVLRGVAVAASDCALGYGLEWLRSIDSDTGCGFVVAELFDCCPNVSASDCTDPICVEQCIQRRLRLLYGCRVTQGPTVLRRREMDSRGAMAEVELVVVATDPFVYSGAAAYSAASPQALQQVDAAPHSAPVPQDAFALPVTHALPPSLVPTPRFAPRVRWDRQVVDVPAPEWGTTMTPTIRLESAVALPAVRLTLSNADGDVVGQWWMDGFPTGGIVTMDFRAREVITESNNIRRRNDAFVGDPSGGPVRWPVLPIGDYTLAVDRASGTAPLMVGVRVLGRVSP